MRESVLMELEPPLVVSWSAFGSLLVCFFVVVWVSIFQEESIKWILFISFLRPQP